MAKKSAVEKNNRRRKMVDRFAAQAAGVEGGGDGPRTRDPEERFEATIKLAELPRNSAKVRIRNRCTLTGRPRGLLSEIRSLAHRAAGSGLARPDPGRGEVELVRREEPRWR